MAGAGARHPGPGHRGLARHEPALDPQLAFYERIASWVAPGGSLLIVGHLHHSGRPGDTDPPRHATVTRDDIVAMFQLPAWRIATSYETQRSVPGGRADVVLHDVVVRAVRDR